MRIYFVIALLTCVSVSSSGQGRRFKNVKNFSLWMMNYYKNPEPQYLFDAFSYSVNNKEILNAGNRSNLVSFFSACLRNDTTRQNYFYAQLQSTTNENYIYSFGSILWLIHTEHADTLLRHFLAQDHLAKYRDEFDQILKMPYPNLYADQIESPSQLDILWAEFFATGNEKSVERIISVLNDIGSDDNNLKTIADAAQWSLIGNAIKHDKVLRICEEKGTVADKKLKATLAKIVRTAKSERKK